MTRRSDIIDDARRYLAQAIVCLGHPMCLGHALTYAVMAAVKLGGVDRARVDATQIVGKP